ncbi:MAG: hypothetical protein WDA24_10655 [Tissierellales bacterium]
MKNIGEKQKSTGINGYEYILQTYNSKKYPTIENQTNATFFPWSMLRDVDAIDTAKFYADTDAVDHNYNKSE